jgi:hypothetical protein
MVSTVSVQRINAATASNRKIKSSSNHGDDSFSLLLAVAASACLVGSAALFFYYNNNHDRNRDRNEEEKPGGMSKKTNSIDNVGDWGKKKKAQNTGRSGGGSSYSNTNNDDFDLPQHLQREVYKEERRKASVKFLAMKKPLYENIEMYGPDGKTMLCTIGTKKANWYVRKELAVWRDIPDCHKSIRLLFEPKNSKSCKKNQKKMASSRANDDVCISTTSSGGVGSDETEMDNDEKLRQYNCTHKLNICVSCGAKDASESTNNNNNNNIVNTADNIDLSGKENGSDNEDDESTTVGLMRHYVVPYAYRKLLPTKFKTHLPHDVVLLCLDCHVDAEQAAKKQRTDVYEKLYRKDPSTRPAVVIDQNRKRLKSYSRALWKHKDKLPQERIQQYESVISDHLAAKNLESSTRSDVGGASIPIPEDVLRDLALNIEPERKNPRYIPLADLVVENLCQTDEGVSEFVVGWREFFVATLHPRYLPVGWSVHSPVEIDVDPDDSDIDDDGETKEETTKK